MPESARDDRLSGAVGFVAGHSPAVALREARAEGREESLGHRKDALGLDPAHRHLLGRPRPIGGERRERARARLPIFNGRHRGNPIRGRPDSDQPVRRGKRQGPQQDRIKHREQRRGRADAERKGKHSGQRKARRLRKPLKRVPHDRPQSREPGPLPYLAAPFRRNNRVSKREPGGAPGLFAAHAPGHKRVGFLLEVLRDFFGEVAVHTAARQEPTHLCLLTFFRS